jgi:hypothetical protein
MSDAPTFGVKVATAIGCDDMVEALAGQILGERRGEATMSYISAPRYAAVTAGPTPPEPPAE